MIVKMKLSLVRNALLAGLLMLPLLAGAATVEGKMNGISCAVAGVFCPIDKADPLVALESDFVVQQPDGIFYIIPNVDRAVKARVVLEDVQVSGDVNDQYKSITADQIQVKRGGEWKTVWSQEMQDELRQQLFRGSQ
jgi:hypothetical protein